MDESGNVITGGVRELADAELDDKVSVFPAVNEDARVLVLHAVAQNLIRSSILEILPTILKDFGGIELDLLRAINKKSEQLTEGLLSKIAHDLYIFDFNHY